VMIVGNNWSLENAEQWRQISRIWDDEFHFSTKPSQAVKGLASRLIAGAADDAEKLRRLYEFCQKEIANLWWNDTPEMREAKRLSEQSGGKQTPQETIEKRNGFGNDIDRLFAALARAAGFEVKLARNAGRNDLFNINIPKGWDFLDRELIAVKTGGRWQFFAPGRYWVPCGMLDWRDEGVTALLCDPRKVLYEDTTVSPAELSQLHRKGRFVLDAEGTLEGSVEQTMTGHLAVDLKAGDWNEATDAIDRAQKRLQQFVDGLRRLLAALRWRFVSQGRGAHGVARRTIRTSRFHAANPSIAQAYSLSVHRYSPGKWTAGMR